MSDNDREQLLRNTYAAFNARDIDTVLTKMHADVEWPNGWEGGYVRGHEAVRDYWTRQWAAIDPRVDPEEFATAPDGRIIATARQVVRDKSGAVVTDRYVQHVYRFRDGLVDHMEIRET
jgi:ketosteroid isomerase-like protein